MYEELRRIHPGVDLRWRDKQCETLLYSHPTIARSLSFIFHWYTAARVTFGAGYRPLELILGCGVELNDEGCLTIRAMILSGLSRVMDGDRYLWLGTQSAPIGTIESQRALELVFEEMSSRFPEALEYVDGRLG